MASQLPPFAVFEHVKAGRMLSKREPIWVLSIDPAKAAGMALLHDDGEETRLLKCAAVDGSTWISLVAVAREFMVGIPPEKTHCVIEDGILTGRAKAKSVMTLGRRRGLAQAAAEAVGITRFAHIVPNDWQDGLGYRRGGDSKRFSLDYARDVYQVENMSDDVTDAVCLGHFYISTYLTGKIL